ncbi:hypothetical protein J2755_000285 [Methanohalophilus levihalophilus]|uniref:hypothetical protein n=1 Tax=Methanohalophilus levihalophilus TaxID=1431282 RepID=UPI001AE5D0B1|nr:hypothetical protein [Methanohalophilus levihalophilus]MBP2029365.1 hypothetical protein [Methanohalophilus levihalophilus]
MGSGKIFADPSQQQVVDFKDLILQINFYIIQNSAFSNMTAVYELVEQLDTIMHPYKDQDYRDEVEGICKERAKGKTANQQKALDIQRSREYMKKKHEALMKLAYRKRFLPSASMGRMKPEEAY